jgi:hypothetical protein
VPYLRRSSKVKVFEQMTEKVNSRLTVQSIRLVLRISFKSVRIGVRTGRGAEGGGNSRAGVSIRRRSGHIWWGYILHGELFPDDLAEPLVREDVSGAVPHVSVSFRWVSLHQLEDEVRRSWIEERWPSYCRWALRDLVVQSHGTDIGFVEWR